MKEIEMHRPDSFFFSSNNFQLPVFLLKMLLGDNRLVALNDGWAYNELDYFSFSLELELHNSHPLETNTNS